MPGRHVAVLHQLPLQTSSARSFILLKYTHWFNSQQPPPCISPSHESKQNACHSLTISPSKEKVSYFMGLFLGSFLAFEKETCFPTNRELELCCSYVKFLYHSDHRPTVPSTLEKRTDYRVSRTFYASYGTTVLPTDANSSSCDSQRHWLILSLVLWPVCTAHPNLSFYWLQNSPCPQAISHRLLLNSFPNCDWDITSLTPELSRGSVQLPGCRLFDIYILEILVVTAP